MSKHNTFGKYIISWDPNKYSNWYYIDLINRLKVILFFKVFKKINNVVIIENLKPMNTEITFHFQRLECLNLLKLYLIMIKKRIYYPTMYSRNKKRNLVVFESIYNYNL